MLYVTLALLKLPFPESCDQILSTNFKSVDEIKPEVLHQYFHMTLLILQYFTKWILKSAFEFWFQLLFGVEDLSTSFNPELNNMEQQGINETSSNIRLFSVLLDQVINFSDWIPSGLQLCLCTSFTEKLFINHYVDLMMWFKTGPINIRNNFVRGAPCKFKCKGRYTSDRN